MNVVVTGATGFVGSHLADRLIGRGDTVTSLARSSSKAAQLSRMGCRYVRGSLGDPQALRSLVEGADLVFHAAGRTAASHEHLYYHVNRGGTERLAAAARDAKVPRLVYVSSLAAAGPTTRGRPISDTVVPSPVSDYGRSKLGGEDALRRASVPFTIVRPPAVYGPRDREFLKLFKLARLGVAPILGAKDQELSLIYVGDLVEALIAAATDPRTLGRTYHAAHPQIVTQLSIVEAIGRAVGRTVKPVVFSAGVTRGVLRITGAAARLFGVTTLLTTDKANEFLADAWTCTSSELERDTGWRAAVELEGGLEETNRWYRDQRWL